MKVQPRIASKPNSLTGSHSKAPAAGLLSENSKSDSVEISGSKTKKRSRLFGQIGKFVAKVPKFVAHTARFIGATLFGGLQTAIQVAAGSLGLVGMAGLGIAGALEIRDGMREKDAAKVMAGSGEVVRGAHSGLLSAGHLLDMGRHAGTVAAATACLGVLQGGIHLTSGALKIHEGRETDNRRRRIEGYLEMGMGTASLAMLAGPVTPLAIGTYATLAGARFSVVNWERIKTGFSKAKGGIRRYWETMKAEYRGDTERADKLARLVRE